MRVKKYAKKNIGVETNKKISCELYCFLLKYPSFIEYSYTSKYFFVSCAIT